MLKVKDKDMEVENVEIKEVVDESKEEVEETTTSLENIEKATSVIQDKVTKLRFEDCVVTGFTQKATNTKVTLNSADFEVTVTIKDNERWGL